MSFSTKEQKSSEQGDQIIVYANSRKKKAIPTFLQCTHLIPGVGESLGLKLQVKGNKN